MALTERICTLVRFNCCCICKLQRFCPKKYHSRRRIDLTTTYFIVYKMKIFTLLSNNQQFTHVLEKSAGQVTLVVQPIQSLSRLLRIQMRLAAV